MKNPDLWVIVLFVVILFVAFVWLTPLCVKNHQLRIEMNELQRIHNEQSLKLMHLRKEIDRLSWGDRKTVEKVAREKFNYCYEGEELYQLEVVPPEGPQE